MSHFPLELRNPKRRKRRPKDASEIEHVIPLDERAIIMRTLEPSSEQQEVLDRVIRVNDVSYSQLVESSLAAYVPAAFDIRWPHKTRKSRPAYIKRYRKQSRTYGVMHTPAQQRVLKFIERKHNLIYATLLYRALTEYLAAEYGETLPPRTGGDSKDAQYAL